ncbi:MAG: YdcF family protein [Deltaproteobacteria bacterium]|nr:YdcF family protein [Deltaproteobacteria bacterium]
MVRVAMGVTVVLIIGLAVFLGAGHRFLCHQDGTAPGPADLIVVLAGPPDEDRERVAAGVALANAGQHRFMLLPLRHRALTWSWFVRRYRIENPIPDERVLFGRDNDPKSRHALGLGGTFAEAEKTVDVMRAQGFASAIVVSSCYHIRRARLAFERANKDPGLTFDFHAIGIEDAEPNGPWWLDGGYALKVADEYLKLLGGYLFYKQNDKD